MVVLTYSDINTLGAMTPAASDFVNKLYNMSVNMGRRDEEKTEILAFLKNKNQVLLMTK